MRINHKSDFDFYLVLRVGNEKSYRELGWPKYPFRAVFHQGSIDTGREVATAYMDEDGTTYNCVNEEGKIHVYCDNPGKVPKGTVNCEFTADLEHVQYGDRVRTVVSQHKSVMELVDGVGEDGAPWDMVLYLPDAYLALADASALVEEEPMSDEDRLAALEARVAMLEGNKQ